VSRTARQALRGGSGGRGGGSKTAKPNKVQEKKEREEYVVALAGVVAKDVAAREVAKAGLFRIIRRPKHSPHYARSVHVIHHIMRPPRHHRIMHAVSTSFTM